HHSTLHSFPTRRSSDLDTKRIISHAGVVLVSIPEAYSGQRISGKIIFDARFAAGENHVGILSARHSAGYPGRTERRPGVCIRPHSQTSVVPGALSFQRSAVSLSRHPL